MVLPFQLYIGMKRSNVDKGKLERFLSLQLGWNASLNFTAIATTFVLWLAGLTIVRTTFPLTDLTIQ